jgi:hypothetical protein
MKPKHHKGLATLLAAGICSSVLFAQETAKPPAAKLSLEEMSSSTRIIPSPGEILTTLKDAKDTDWAAAAEAAAKSMTPVKDMDTTQAAVILGQSTANAFLALQAKNSDLLEKCSVRILDSAKKLGASEEVLAKGKTIADLAAAGKWADAYPLLDGIFLAAQSALKEIEDDDSLTIASASGWLTGISIFSGQVAAKYSESGGKALRQGDIVKSLLAKLNALPEAAKDQDSVKTLIAAFTQLQPLVSVDKDAAVADASVKSISEITGKAMASLK